MIDSNLSLPPIVLAALLGLLIGSFINVVVYRLPIMLEREWLTHARELLDSASDSAPTGEKPVFNLARPGSACPHCNHAIAWQHNIPIVSFILLRGKCATCQKPIAWRYPLVEACSAVLTAYCVWRWGFSANGLVWTAFSLLLMTAALIDWDTTLLPDGLTLPLLWLGLAASSMGLGVVSLHDAVWGSMVGYVSLWSVYWGFKLLTGKDGMGYGDFKLFAALGAWFGWAALVPLILAASLVGIVIGLIMQFRQTLRQGGVVPFGPFLAGAGLLWLVWGQHPLIRQWYG